VPLGVLGEVVAEACGIGKPFLPCVGAPVAGQLVGASKLQLAALHLKGFSPVGTQMVWSCLFSSQHQQKGLYFIV